MFLDVTSEAKNRTAPFGIATQLLSVLFWHMYCTSCLTHVFLPGKTPTSVNRNRVISFPETVGVSFAFLQSGRFPREQVERLACGH